MYIYEISNGEYSTQVMYSTIEEAQEYADSLGIGFIVTCLCEYIPPSVENTILNFIGFGKEIMWEFRKDIFSMDISVDDAISLLEKFEEIERLLNIGSLKNVRTKISDMQTDLVFTDILKSKYLELIDVYLESYL